MTKKLSKATRDGMISEMGNRVVLFATAIAPVYATLGWTWLGSRVLPTVDNITDHIDEKLSDLQRHPDVQSSNSGGIDISFEDGSDGPELSLRFVFQTTVYAKRG